MQNSNTLWLAKQELKNSWLYFIPTLLFIILLGLGCSIAFVAEPVKEINVEPNVQEFEILLNNVLVDFLFLYGLPFLSIYTREHWIFTASNKDPFSKRLLFLRSHPFSAQEIVQSRLLLMLVTLSTSLAIFFITLQFFPGDFSKHLSLLQYLWFSLIWTGYVFLFGGFSLFMELATNGKVYFWVSCLVAIPLAALVLIVLPTGGIVLWTTTLAKTNGPVMAILSLFIGLISLFGWTRLTEKRIGKRDLLL